MKPLSLSVPTPFQDNWVEEVKKCLKRDMGDFVASLKKWWSTKNGEDLMGVVGSLARAVESCGKLIPRQRGQIEESDEQERLDECLDSWLELAKTVRENYGVITQKMCDGACMANFYFETMRHLGEIQYLCKKV